MGEAALLQGLVPRQGPGGDGCRGGGGVYSGTGPAAAGASSSSLFSSTSSLTDDEEDGDGATSSSPPGRHVSSSVWEAVQMDGAAGGPLYELSTMLDHLPALRSGLSKYYQGRSQSFTSLADVGCVEDLAKKMAPCTRRSKASRGCAAALGAKNRLWKTISKKPPRSSPDRLLSTARSKSILRSSVKPPAYQGKREVYRC